MGPDPAKEIRAGRLLQRPAGHFTFEPTPLPPSGLALGGQIHQCLSEADYELGYLHGQIAARPAAQQLVELACLREAVASCQLEGSPVSVCDLLWWQFDGARAEGLSGRRGDIRICANYASLLADLPHESDEASPLLQKSLCQIHRQLLAGVRGRDERSGRIRQAEIWLGPQGSTLETAHFVPPAPEHIPEHMALLAAFAAGEVAMPPLARIALMMYQLETIHPFVDGSGRVTRLTLLRLLSTIHGDGVRLLCPSILLAADVGGNFQRLQQVRREGDWQGWVSHFGALLRDSARAGSTRLIREEGVLKEYEKQILQQQPTIRDTGITLLRYLASRPIISVQQVAKICGRTFANANLLVGRLQNLEILTEITGKQRHRRYVYTPFLSEVQGD